jgi:hypothetical protein
VFHRWKNTGGSVGSAVAYMKVLVYNGFMPPTSTDGSPNSATTSLWVRSWWHHSANVDRGRAYSPT